jgi:hypothetical protein
MFTMTNKIGYQVDDLMNNKWKKLCEEFEENGYTPYDIQRMVMFYEMTKNIDDKLKKLYEDEANERDNSNSLRSD